MLYNKNLCRIRQLYTVCFFKKWYFIKEKSLNLVWDFLVLLHVIYTRVIFRWGIKRHQSNSVPCLNITRVNVSRDIKISGSHLETSRYRVHRICHGLIPPHGLVQKGPFPGDITNILTLLCQPVFTDRRIFEQTFPPKVDYMVSLRLNFISG